MSQASIFLNKPTKSLYDRPQSSPPPHPLPMMSAILFTLLQHQFALILHHTLHLGSYVSHFWNAFCCLFYQANVRPPLKTFPRGLLWYHFPSPPLCGLIRGTFSMFPQRWLEHQWVVLRLSMCACAPFVHVQGWCFVSFFCTPMPGFWVINKHLSKWTTKVKWRWPVFT